jgi:hypothetical protein
MISLGDKKKAPSQSWCVKARWQCSPTIRRLPVSNPFLLLALDLRRTEEKIVSFWDRHFFPEARPPSNDKYTIPGPEILSAIQLGDEGFASLRGFQIATPVGQRSIKNGYHYDIWGLCDL